MNPQQPDGLGTPSIERTPVPPPNLSAPTMLSPDTTIAPSSAGAESVHGDVTAPHVFMAKPAEVVSYNKLNPAGTLAPAPREELGVQTSTVAQAPTAIQPVVAATSVVTAPAEVEQPSTTVAGAAQANAPTTPPPAAPPRKKRPWMNKRVIVPAVAGIVLIAVVLVIIARMTGSQAALATKFVASIQSGNASEAYSLTSKKFQDATDKSTFEDFAVKESYLLPRSKPQVVSRQVAESGGLNTATVAVNIKASSGGTDYHAIIQMVEEDGKWAVFSADIKSGTYSEPLSTSK